MNWSSREIEPLRLRLRRMATEEATGSGERHEATGRSISVHPDKFYGYPNDDVLDWFCSFERIARANDWGTDKQGRMVSAYLRGPAGDHYEKVADGDKANYAVIKKSLTERFCPADMRRSAYSNLAGKKQGKTESVNEFASNIQRLVYRSFPSSVSNEVVEMTAREHFILGLRPELMRRVTMADPTTFNDAIRVALREESLEESFGRKINAVEAEPQKEDQMTQVIGLLGKLLQREESGDRVNFKGPQRNFNGTKNSFTREGRPVCNFCRKAGHIERKCFTKFPHLKGAKTKTGSEN